MKNHTTGRSFPERIKVLIEKAITPPGKTRRDGIQYWQDRVIFSLLLIVAVFGFIAFIPSVALSIAEDLWIVAIADTIIYIWALVLFFRRSIPFTARAISVIILSYILGMILIITLGPFGGGPVWIFFFPIITALFLNYRFTIISLVINAITVVLLGVAIHINYLDWRNMAGFPMEAWGVIGLNFVLLNTLGAVSVSSIINGLQQSLSFEQSALASVEGKNLELEQFNLDLQQVIDEREKIERALQKSEKALEESEIRFKDLVNLLPLSYFLMDKDFRLQYLNRKAYKVFRFQSLEDSDGNRRRLMDLLNTADGKRFEHHTRTLMQDRASDWQQYTGQTKNGYSFPVEILSDVIDVGDDTPKIQGIIVDITDRVEAEEIKKAKDIAEERNNAISDWVNFIAHELKTPISGPIQFSYLGLRKLSESKLMYQYEYLKQELESHFPDNKNDSTSIPGQFELMGKTIFEREMRYHKCFDRIFSSGKRMERLLGELLDLSKLEVGKMQFNPHKTNYLNIIRLAAKEMEAIFEAKNITLEIEDSGIEYDLSCDDFRVGQVVRNLFSNAIKFSPPDSKISVSFKETAIQLGRRKYDREIRALQTTIADQGVGIPKDQIKLVFEKFRQSRKTRIGEGSGLGLLICKQIIAAHTGTIWAESEDGKGTRLHFTLPYESPRTENQKRGRC